MKRIEFNNTYPATENFDGLGAVYHGFAGMPDKDGRVYKEELCELEADRVADLSPSVVRTFYSTYAYDAENNCWNWENEKMQAFYAWLGRMKKRNIDVSVNTGWWFPSDIIGTRTGKSPFAVEGDFEKSVQNYADWVSETVHQLIEVHGFTNVKYIHLFTEPQYFLYKMLPNNEKNTYKSYCYTVKVVHETLIRDGRRNLVKIVGPNEGSTKTSRLNKYVSEHIDECIDIYSSHNYQDDLTEYDTELNQLDLGLCMTVPGARMWQYTKLKPNTDYCVKVKITPQIQNMLDVYGAFYFGAWRVEDDDLDYDILITRKKNQICRLTFESVKMIDAVSLKSNTTNSLEFVFNSGNNSEAFIGAINEIKGDNNRVYIEYLDLKETENDKMLLNDSDLKKLTNGDLLEWQRDPFLYEEQKWLAIAVKAEFTTPYGFIQNCVKTSLRYVPDGKPFWFDEYNVRAEKKAYDTTIHGTRLAAIMVALINSGANNSLMWTLFDQQWPDSNLYNDDCFVDGDHRCGFMPVLTRSLVPYPAYYSAGLIFKYVRGGKGVKVIPYNGDGKTVGCKVVNPDGNVTVVVVNNKAEAEKLNISLGNENELKLYRYTYNPETVAPDERAKLPDADKVFTVTNEFEEEIPGYGVYLYTTRN